MKCNFTTVALSRVLPSLLGIEFVLGTVANVVALWIFCFYVKPWKSSTVLLFNLALADLFLLAALPFRAIYYHFGLHWSFGEPLCNIVLFMLALNRSGSTFFLVAIAVDRYMHVLHPQHFINQLSVGQAALGALGIWVLTGSMTSHIFRLKHQQNGFNYCESFSVDSKPEKNFTWHKFLFVLTFVFPLLALSYCTMHIIAYLRSRRQLGSRLRFRKALVFMTVVVVLFIVCFLPTSTLQVVIWVKTSLVAHTDTPDQVCSTVDGLTVAFFFSFSLTYLNSALDPVVYYFSNPIFQKACRSLLHLLPIENTDTTDKNARETGSQSQSQL